MSGEGTVEEPVRWQWRRVDFNEPFVITEQIGGSRVGVHIARVDSEPPAGGHGVRVEVDGQWWLLRPISPIRWLGSERDNFGFAAWVRASAAQLIRLGQGWHYGVWYGRGIMRSYGLDHRRLALYDVERWTQIPERLPDRVESVPIVGRARGPELSSAVDRALRRLERSGSLAVPGQAAEGIEITPVLLPIVRFKMALKPS